MKRIIFFVAGSVFVALMVAGCSGGNSLMNSNNTQGTTPLTINTGDATNDQIIAFELTLNTITLNGGSNPSVLAKPAEIEFVHQAGTFEPLVLVHVPAGTYTGATISVSNPEVVTVDPTTHQVTKLAATLTSSTVNVSFPSTTFSSGTPAVLNLDLSLASSVTINGNAATVNPAFTATISTVPSQEKEDDNDGELRFVRGTVASVAAPNFTINPAHMSQSLTFATDGNTRFIGVTGVSQLMTGFLVKVIAVTQSDGSLLAKLVITEVENAQGMEADGIITSVTPTSGTPITAITITDRDDISPSGNAPAFGSGVTAQIGSNTTFATDRDEDSSLQGVTLPAFDASHIGLGQNVEVDTEMGEMEMQSAGSVTANKIELQEQALTGTVSALNGGTFTLNLASTSAFASLTTQTTVTVNVESGTQIKNVTLANNATVRVRGLLFINGTSYTLIATRITQP